MSSAWRARISASWIESASEVVEKRVVVFMDWLERHPVSPASASFLMSRVMRVWRTCQVHTMENTVKARNTIMKSATTTKTRTCLLKAWSPGLPARAGAIFPVRGAWALGAGC